MVTLTKGKDTKFLSEGSSLIERLKQMGWIEIETPEPEVKNGKSRKSSN